MLSVASSMIAPRTNQTLLTERPAPKIPRWMRMVAPVVSIFRTKSRDDTELNRELRSLLSDVTNCNDRSALKSLLGNPDYAMIGTLYGQTDPDGTEQRPDLVECYSRGRLNVELWFRDNRLWRTVGFLMPTSWDFVCGIEP